jgi:hypothetical protein
MANIRKPARGPKKWELVVLALEDAGGATRVVDTEDVAVAAHKLAPSSFSWRKHPSQIDLDSVRISLTDARKEKYGELVIGSIREGWRLTEAGTEWCLSLGDTLRKTGGAMNAARASTRSESKYLEKERVRLLATPAYATWRGGSDASAREAAAVFRIDAYTPRSSWSRKINRVTQLVASDPIVEFVSAMAVLVPLAYPDSTKDTPDIERTKP